MKQLLMIGLVCVMLLLPMVAQAQEFTVQMQPDGEGLWRIVCIAGCDDWALMGTVAELDVRFPVIWDAVDYVYWLLDRRNGTHHVPVPRPG